MNLRYIQRQVSPRGYINGKAGNTSTVEANSTIKLEVKVKSEEGVTYQWYSASGDFVEDKLEEKQPQFFRLR